MSLLKANVLNAEVLFSSVTMAGLLKKSFTLLHSVRIPELMFVL